MCAYSVILPAQTYIQWDEQRHRLMEGGLQRLSVLDFQFRDTTVLTWGNVVITHITSPAACASVSNNDLLIGSKIRKSLWIQVTFAKTLIGSSKILYTAQMHVFVAHAGKWKYVLHWLYSVASYCLYNIIVGQKVPRWSWYSTEKILWLAAGCRFRLVFIPCGSPLCTARKDVSPRRWDYG